MEARAQLSIEVTARSAASSTSSSTKVADQLLAPCHPVQLVLIRLTVPIRFLCLQEGKCRCHLLME